MKYTQEQKRKLAWGFAGIFVVLVWLPMVGQGLWGDKSQVPVGSAAAAISLIAVVAFVWVYGLKKASRGA